MFGCSRDGGAAATIALFGLLISISNAVAGPPSAQQLLNDPNACWIDEEYDKDTGLWQRHAGLFGGRPVSYAPGTGNGAGVFEAGTVDISLPGQTFIVAKIPAQVGFKEVTLRMRRVPCPPPPTSSVYFGIQASKAILSLISTERDSFSGDVTNRFSDSHDPLGVGLILGYKFRPWGNDIVVSPFVSFDYLNMSVNHTFAGGSFLGTRSNFAGTAGVKIGPEFGNGFWLYGIAGVSALNETLQVNFLPVSSSSTTTVAGATIGVGGAIQPGFLQGFGRPVSVFAEYQHTWWQDANFNTPAASPFFNYTFRREDDVVKVGFTIDLSSPPPPTSGPQYVKALPAK